MADIRARLAVLPVSLNIGQPIAHRLDHMLSGVRAQIALKIYGEDLDTLRTPGRGPARAAVGACQGLVDLQVEKQVRIPQLRIDVDYERAALYGLTPATVTQALETMSNGRTVSQIVEGNRRFDVVHAPVRPGPLDHGPGRPAHRHADRARAAAHGRRASRRRTGRTRSCARTASAASPSSATATASATWRPSSPTSAASSAETPLPQGYVTRLEGTFQAQEEATLRIGALSLVSLAMIFVVLYSRYQSPALALIIMGNIPLALIGSVIALNIAGQPLSVASMIGFITLAGISARNGILKISHYINLALYEGERFGRGPRRSAAAWSG